MPISCGVHATLWNDVSQAIDAFFADLREHNAADNVLMFLFTEFGRRVRDNGSGTDHGAGGAAFVIGDAVKGGQYGEYPSRKAEDLTQGDLAPDPGLPRPVRHHPGGLAARRRQAHRQRLVRETAFSLKGSLHPSESALAAGCRGQDASSCATDARAWGH